LNSTTVALYTYDSSLSLLYFFGCNIVSPSSFLYSKEFFFDPPYLYDKSLKSDTLLKLCVLSLNGFSLSKLLSLFFRFRFLLGLELLSFNSILFEFLYDRLSLFGSLSFLYLS